MNQNQLLLKGMFGELEKEESALDLVFENDLAAIHNATGAFALLVVDELSNINLELIQIRLDALKKAQARLLEIRSKKAKIQKELYE